MGLFSGTLITWRAYTYSLVTETYFQKIVG